MSAIGASVSSRVRPKRADRWCIALRNFGLKVGVVSSGKFEARIRELVTGSPTLALIVEPLLAVRRVLRQQSTVLHKMLLDTRAP